MYCLALAYGSLYPLTGWRPLGSSWANPLLGAFPKYWTWGDVVANVALYLPLGALLAWSLKGRLNWWSTVASGVVLGLAISGCLETLQSFLPPRVPSSLDWFANTVGAGLGAAAVRFVQPRFRRPHAASAVVWHRPERPDTVRPLVWGLIGLWLAVQCAPQTLMFEAGVLPRPWRPSAVVLSADLILITEAWVVACAMLVSGLLLRMALRPGPYFPFLVSLLIAIGTGANLIAAWVLHGAPLWLPAGAQAGLVLGALGLGLCLPARPSARRIVMLVALVSMVIVGNLTPPHAYRDDLFSTLLQPGLRNLLGLLDALSLAWPLLVWWVVRLDSRS